MKSRDLKRVDYPLEYLYFEFENWDDHRLFLKTNHHNWTKYLSQFSALHSIDVLICEEEKQLIRLIIWESYLAWKTITPGDVLKVDEKHKRDFPYKFFRKSQMYATDKHPYNLVSRLYRSNDEISSYKNGLNNNVIRVDIEINQSGMLEKLLNDEEHLLNLLLAHPFFINRDVYMNKFNPRLIQIYYFIIGNENNYIEILNNIKTLLKKIVFIKKIHFTNYGYLKRESIYTNDEEIV